MNRTEMVARIQERREPWDIVVIGGGATGVGIAVDASLRGYATLLLERSDFGKGTSSRSTKLVHGGVRYLRQGNVKLVYEALHERGLLYRNATHLVHRLGFVMPSYGWGERYFYGLGLKIYDLLAGRKNLGSPRLLSKNGAISLVPTLEPEGLRGGVFFFDGQFDDARLLVDLAQTAANQGATLVNYMQVTGLRKGAGGKVDTVIAMDRETGEECAVNARIAINATGVFSDEIRRMDEPEAVPMIRPSQGIHFVLDRSFLPGDTAIIVPHTDDGRVLFAIPWHQHTIVGTTDTPVPTATLEPRALPEEVDFVLAHASRYLTKDPARSDVRSVFAGLRPLVSTRGTNRTSKLSRDHVIVVDTSGLMTVTGGKWTTYRRMASDSVDQAAALAGLSGRPCGTETLAIHGSEPGKTRLDGIATAAPLSIYGSVRPRVEELIDQKPELGQQIHAALPYLNAQVVWAARYEMARTIEDVLARRTRAILLDAKAAIESAPRVASLLAGELGRDQAWQTQQITDFEAVARGYLLSP